MTRLAVLLTLAMTSMLGCGGRRLAPREVPLAEQGSADGRVTAQDAAWAALMQVCEQGGMSGCAALAGMYEQGRGVSVDLPRAAALYQRACQGGVARSCGNLGAMYQEGSGVPRNAAGAASLYQSACRGGDLESCAGLGQMYVDGEGVPQDTAQAVALFSHACERGMW